MEASEDMPEAMTAHSLIALNSTTVMTLGQEGPIKNDKTYLFNFESNQWTEGKNLKDPTFETHAGLVTYPDEQDIVVVSGGASLKTSIFHLDENHWTLGKDFPGPLRRGTSVQHGNTFIIVGGTNNLKDLNTIWMFEPRYRRWILQDKTLKVPRSWATAIFVPQNLCHQE